MILLKFCGISLITILFKNHFIWKYKPQNFHQNKIGLCTVQILTVTDKVQDRKAPAPDIIKIACWYYAPVLHNALLYRITAIKFKEAYRYVCTYICLKNKNQPPQKQTNKQTTFFQ